MKTGLITSYTRLSDAALTNTAYLIVESLTGNEYFLVTIPPLPEFVDLQQAFHAAIVKASAGDRTEIALKNQLRGTLLNAMQQLAKSIQIHAAGDKAKLSSSGFTLLSDRLTAPAMEAPENFQMLDGLDKGELILRCRRVLTAVSYIFEYMENEPPENGKCAVKMSSTRQCTISGLAGGTRIFARVTAVGRRNQFRMSEVLSRVVQ